MRNRILAMLGSGAVTLACLCPPPAGAAQNGLVNVDVSNNTIQVPVAVAANACQVQVGVLSQALAQGPVNCTALGSATATGAGGGGGGGANQQGLVNLAITNNTVQVPIGIAANICNVQAAVLAQQMQQGGASCAATGNSTASG